MPTPTSRMLTNSPGYFGDKTIREVMQALRAGIVTSCELVERTLDHIARLNPILNCFASVDREGALKAAKSLDQDFVNGRDHGPLHGIPIAIKDIIDVAGQITTAGSALFRNRVAA